jgi:hypothetical protein
MKATIKLLEKQHAALVQVIQFLDSHRAQRRAGQGSG